MKKINMLSIVAIFLALILVSCGEDDVIVEPMDFDFSGEFLQKDQNGRPGINTVFVSTDRKDEFNMTIPSNMANNFSAAFEDRLLALNPGYTTNALGLDAPSFSSVLVSDVLNVSTTGTTTFFDGVNVLTGRTLADDVIDVELLLIFGGPDGSANGVLTSDNVDGNDKSFSNSFPYLASPW